MTCQMAQSSWQNWDLNSKGHHQVLPLPVLPRPSPTAARPNSEQRRADQLSKVGEKHDVALF